MCCSGQLSDRGEDEKSMHVLGNKQCIIQEYPREVRDSHRNDCFLQEFNGTGRDPRFVKLILSELSTEATTVNCAIRIPVLFFTALLDNNAISWY